MNEDVNGRTSSVDWTKQCGKTKFWMCRLVALTVTVNAIISHKKLGKRKYQKENYFNRKIFVVCAHDNVLDNVHNKTRFA